MRYIIISPVRNELGHIEKTLRSVGAQTVLPTRWVIVDDGSTDGTLELLRQYAVMKDWIKIVERPDRGFRAAGSGVVDAFYEGYKVLNDESWDFIVKLDGDVSFEADYFQRCFEVFRDEAELGIGGGTIYTEKEGVLNVESPGDPTFHVRGATKIYRRQCWVEAVSPLISAPGWDTVDEVKANLKGWKTRTFPHIHLVQHKPTGEADGVWRDAFKNGLANYVAGYHPIFFFGKCIRRVTDRPVVVRACALLAGFMSGYLRRMPQISDPEAIRYLRQQQVRRLLFRKSIYSSKARSF
jgi:glycosyltransferase involved in cell wall biosynthesis